MVYNIGSDRIRCAACIVRAPGGGASVYSHFESKLHCDPWNTRAPTAGLDRTLRQPSTGQRESIESRPARRIARFHISPTKTARRATQALGKV